MNYFNKIILFFGLALTGAVYPSEKINIFGLKQELEAALKATIDRFEKQSRYFFHTIHSSINGFEQASLTLERIKNDLFLLRNRYEKLNKLNTSVDFLALADHLEALPRKERN